MIETIQTPGGLSVAGASAGLLGELLAELDVILEESRPGHREIMRPGATVEEIRSTLEPRGIEPNDEIITWFGWHDGIREGSKILSRILPIRLSKALEIVDHEVLGVGDKTLWHPAWIPVTEGGLWAARADTEIDPPPVRPVQRDMGTHTQDAPPTYQVISLCTPIAWRLQALREGWERFNPTTGRWEADKTLFPAPWWDTLLV
jgi:hypothetical protein